MNILSGLGLAFSFLTRLPVSTAKGYSDDDFKKSFIWFPVTGLAIGSILWAVAKLLAIFGAEALFASFISLSLLAFLTGGIHIDGLADTVDGFFGGKDRESSLRIMKEPAVGSFGMTGITLLLIGKFCGIYFLISAGAPALIIPALAISRWGMVSASFNAEYPREYGTGRSFVGAVSTENFLMSTGIAFLIAAIFAGWWAVLSILLAGGGVKLIRLYSERKIGGITGDVLGATNELLELLLLFVLFFNA